MQRYHTIVLAMVIVFGSHLWFKPQAAFSDTSSEKKQSNIFFKRIAVMPFLVGHHQPNMDESLDKTLSCPINQICTDDPSIQSNAGTMLMQFVHAALQKRFAGYVIPLNQTQDAYAGIRLDGTKDSPRALALRMGKRLSADLVMVGAVWRYKDRSTKKGFTDKPASVAFALYMVKAESGRRLWRGIYNERQGYVLNDMAKFFKRIKMGFNWLSADELARYGVKEVLRPFPKYIKPDPLTLPDLSSRRKNLR